MFPSRLHITKKASDSLVYIKSKTKLTPNILARISFCISLSKGAKPMGLDFPLNGLEFNTTTLFGENTSVYYHSLISIEPDVQMDKLAHLVAFHIENGVQYLRGIKSIEGLASLLSEERFNMVVK